jgi:hypothetical protein
MALPFGGDLIAAAELSAGEELGLAPPENPTLMPRREE